MIGIIGKKEGMTQIYSDEGNVIPVTLIKIEKNIIANKKTSDKDGYNALVVGVIDVKEKHTSKPVKGQYKNGIVPKKILKEFRTDDVNKYEIGQEISLDILNDIKFVDVTGVSKGKGFQGVMKRHHFHGGPKTHGSKFHRQNGSTGQNTYPGHVFKGLKRAGRMGNEKVTLQNLKVIEINQEENTLLIKGCIPGKYKDLVIIHKAVKNCK